MHLVDYRGSRTIMYRILSFLTVLLFGAQVNASHMANDESADQFGLQGSEESFQVSQSRGGTYRPPPRPTYRPVRPSYRPVPVRPPHRVAPNFKSSPRFIPNWRGAKPPVQTSRPTSRNILPTSKPPPSAHSITVRPTSPHGEKISTKNRGTRPPKSGATTTPKRDPANTIARPRVSPNGSKAVGQHRSNQGSQDFRISATGKKILVGKPPSNQRAVKGGVGSRAVDKLKSQKGVSRSLSSLSDRIKKTKPANDNKQNGKSPREILKALEKHNKSAVALARRYAGLKIMIGKYAAKDSLTNRLRYTQAARNARAKFFKVSERTYNSWSKEKQWAMNRRFLNDAIKNRSRIFLSTPEKYASGAYKDEIEYLKKNGYRVSSNGLYMYR